MGNQKEIIISGVGGQGMMVCGAILGEAAAVHEKKHVTLSSEYGIEARGSFAKSDLIISDDEIFFIGAENPALVVCLAQAAYEHYSGGVPDGTLLVYDENLVEAGKNKSGKERGVPITAMSKQIGNPMVANIITVGIIAAALQTASAESLKKAIASHFKKYSDENLEKNFKAFDMGYEAGKNLIG